MKKINFKNIYPYLIAIGIFILLGYAYFPQMLEGKVMNQHDISSWWGSAQEIFNFRKATGGQEPLWTGSMFSGMPTNMISIYYPGNYTSKLVPILNIFQSPASWIIVSMIGFYLLMLCFKVNKWIAVLGAIAFGFCSYNFIIIQAGHSNKMSAISYMPWILASIVYAYRYSKPFLGAAFLGITLSLQIIARHPQITYYLGFIILFYVISEAVTAFKNKTIPHFIKVSLILLLGGMLGIASNVNSLWPTAEYAKYTMRGGSELTHNKDVSSDGLSTDYALAWSYGIEETPNLLIPNFNGGSSGGSLSKSSETYKLLKQAGAGAQADQIIKQLPTYWGTQPFTSGPMYLGAISVFLFVLGLCLIKGAMKWWIAGISLLAVMLAWGSHFLWFSKLFLEYVPYYNKFRTPSMILTILQVTVPLLGFYTVNQIFGDKIDRKQVVKGLKIALGITAGFCALFALLPSLAGSFTSPGDANNPDWLQHLPTDRKSMLRADAFRSLAFILLSAGVIWMGYIKKIKFQYAIIALGALLLADLWTVNKRYLNEKDFVVAKEFDQQFKARPVDTEILKDKDPNYRVFDLTINTFNNSHVSYHHKTIGGYSAAKLQRYQEMIEYNIVPEQQRLIASLRKSNSQEEIDSTLAELPTLNMLNTKYFVLDPNAAPYKNKSALGNAWFVGKYNLVNSADEEILAIRGINPAETAVVNKKFESMLNNLQIEIDTNATIELLSYAPNKLEYKYKAATPQLAVFSEVYYPAGWNAYIDGEKAEYFGVNYILRGMVVPQGEHNITFEYRPDSFYIGANISRIASGLLFLFLIGSILWYGIGYFKKEKKS